MYQLTYTALLPAFSLRFNFTQTCFTFYFSAETITFTHGFDEDKVLGVVELSLLNWTVHGMVQIHFHFHTNTLIHKIPI